MIYNTIHEIIGAIVKWCAKFDSNIPKLGDAVNLMVGTAAVESKFKYRKQIGGGPAVGLWQMELTTASDIWNRYLKHKKEYWNILAEAEELEKNIHIPFPESIIARRLVENDDIACVLARIKYRMIKEPIPPRPYQQAVYWKQYYNTPEGAGMAEDYMDTWIIYECEKLIYNELKKIGIKLT